MLVISWRGKPEYLGKNLSEQSREPTNSIHICRRVRKSNPGHIGGRGVLWWLLQPCSLFDIKFQCLTSLLMLKHHSFFSNKPFTRYQLVWFTKFSSVITRYPIQARQWWLCIKLSNIYSFNSTGMRNSFWWHKLFCLFRWVPNVTWHLKSLKELFLSRGSHFYTLMSMLLHLFFGS